MEESTWHPLSVRRGNKEPFRLKEGVPDHIRSQLLPMLISVLYELEGAAETIAARLELVIAPELPLGRWIRTLVYDAAADDDLLLDFVDAVVHARLGPYSSLSWHEDVQAISRLLDDGHSVWAVREGPGRLERRVSGEATAMYEGVLSMADGVARNMSEAWKSVFSRNPNPSLAWSSTTKALEAALAPIVTPKSTLPQYGKLVKDLEARPSKWEADLAGGTSDERVESFIKLLKQIPYAPDRHGKPDFTDIELGQAKSVVLIATSILEIVRQHGFRVR